MEGERHITRHHPPRRMRAAVNGARVVAGSPGAYVRVQILVVH